VQSDGFSVPETRKIILSQSKDALRAVKEEQDLMADTEFDHQVLDEVVIEVRKNCGRLKRTL